VNEGIPKAVVNYETKLRLGACGPLTEWQIQRHVANYGAVYVLMKQAVEQGDIKFFELGALSVTTNVTKREVTLTLTEFIIPPDDVPDDVRRTVKHWSQWVDYWAVDWDNKDDTFHNEWQTYRTRKEPALKQEATHLYAEPGEYGVVVKVIDLLGNDTTKTLKVKVK